MINKGLIIIGFSGMMGSALVKKVEKDKRTLYLINQSGIFKKEWNQDKELLDSNSHNNKTLKDIFSKSSECIYLVNSYPQNISLEDIINGQFYTNIFLTGYFAKIAVETKIERFILGSTTALYYIFTKGLEEVDENTPLKIPDNFILNQRNSYGLSKYMAEEMVKKIVPQERLLILRFDNFFGIGAKDSTIIPKFIKQISEGKDIEVFDWMRGFIYEDDVADMILKTRNEKKNGLANIFNPKNTIHLFDLALLIKSFFPGSTSKISVNNQIKEPCLKFNSIHNNYLNYSMTSLREGIKRIIKKHGK